MIDTATILDALAQDLLETTKATMVGVGLKDSRIINSVNTQVQGGRIILSLPAYARWIERGRSPFRQQGARNTPPPYRVILEWVRRRRIQFRDAKGRFMPYARTAWAVRAGIAKNGIKPRPFTRQAISEAEKKAQEVLPIQLKPLVTTLLLNTIKS